MVSVGAVGKAFVPDSLPPKLDFGPRLVQALSEADRALGELAGLGRTLPTRTCSPGPSRGARRSSALG